MSLAPIAPVHVVAIVREGLWSPYAAIPGVYVALAAEPQCRAAAPGARVDSLGHVALVAPLPRNGRVWVCLGLGRDSVVGAWPIHRIDAVERGGTYHVDCVMHGDAGSPQCACLDRGSWMVLGRRITPPGA